MSAPATLLFARHGNTFAPGDKVVWVGRGTDLPLVQRGYEQAEAAARFLAGPDLAPSGIVCGRLQRVRAFADILGARLGVAVRVDPGLDEIDYGAWEGLSSDEIRALPGGAAAMEEWRHHDRWPENAGWGSSRDDVLAALKGVLDGVLTGGDGARPLLISSNGVLRFAPLILAATGGGPYQMATGTLSAVDRDARGWAVRFWGVAPDSPA